MHNFKQILWEYSLICVGDMTSSIRRGSVSCLGFGVFAAGTTNGRAEFSLPPASAGFFHPGDEAETSDSLQTTRY
jgi:hypothetical protein